MQPHSAQVMMLVDSLLMVLMFFIVIFLSALCGAVKIGIIKAQDVVFLCLSTMLVCAPLCGGVDDGMKAPAQRFGPKCAGDGEDQYGERFKSAQCVDECTHYRSSTNSYLLLRLSQKAFLYRAPSWKQHLVL